MAFNITHACDAQGITLAAMYVRLTASINSAGNDIVVKADWYNVKASFTANLYNMLPVEIDYTYTDLSTGLIKIENVKSFPYNRTTNGADIIQFAHDQYSAYLQEVPESGTNPLIPAADITEADLV